MDTQLGPFGVCIKEAWLYQDNLVEDNNYYLLCWCLKLAMLRHHSQQMQFSLISNLFHNTPNHAQLK